jgi:S-phase kinase-associated protein 1
MLTHLILICQEEKLEPLKNINDDPTIRLLNRLYAKKRKELQERQKLKVFLLIYYVLCSMIYLYFIRLFVLVLCLFLRFTLFQDVQTQEEQKDERSVDELLCFINGDGG